METAADWTEHFLSSLIYIGLEESLLNQDHAVVLAFWGRVAVGVIPGLLQTSRCRNLVDKMRAKHLPAVWTTAAALSIFSPAIRILHT